MSDVLQILPQQIVFGLALAMVGSGAVGTALERFAYRPLYTRGATRLGPLISAVGASIFLQNAIMLTQGTSLVYFTNIQWGGGERLTSGEVRDGANVDGRDGE